MHEIKQYVVLKYGDIYEYYDTLEEAEKQAIHIMQTYGWVMDVCEITFLSTYHPNPKD